MKEFIICVDENDKKIGVEEKIKVHKEGILHRAFSIFIFNDKKELLLQRRALEKYHSPGLWTNTCCSHQRENETLKDMLHKHLDFVTAQAVARLNKDWKADINAFDKGEDHMIMFADIIVDGIIKQFPQKFK